MKNIPTIIALTLVTSSASTLAEDVLYSNRQLSKRQLDADGNYNMCTTKRVETKSRT